MWRCTLWNLKLCGREQGAVSVSGECISLYPLATWNERLAGHLRWCRDTHKFKQCWCDISEAAVPQPGGPTAYKNDRDRIGRMGGMRAPSCRITHHFAISMVGRHKERAS